MCPVAYQLLNEKFTLTEMQKAYEMIMEKKLDKRNFRKKVITTEGLRELNEFLSEIDPERQKKFFIHLYYILYYLYKKVF